MRPLLPLLLSLALLPLALPSASAATCYEFDPTLGDAGGAQVDAGTRCLAVDATACRPGTDGGWECIVVYGADLFPCFCPGPVPW